MKTKYLIYLKYVNTNGDNLVEYETIGIIQKYMDGYVSNKVLNNHVALWNIIKKEGIIESQKSAIIGQIYGGISRLLANINGCEEEELTAEDREDLNDIFMLRLVGIETNIDTILNKKTFNISTDLSL